MCSALILILAMSSLFSTQISGLRKSNRIISGRRALIDEFPYQASLESLYRHLCGGAIIHPRIVISAAHCMAFLNENRHKRVLPADLRVRVGTSTAEEDGTIYEVERVTVHEDYNDHAVTDSHDIGLIILKKSITMDAKVARIKLAARSPVVGEMAWVTGYGSKIPEKRSFQFTNRPLMAVELPIVSTEACKSGMYKRGLIVSDDMICAGGHTSKDACRGDSGGPLAINKTLYGLIAWGVGCGQQGIPGVYTDISQYNEWILKKIESN